MSAANREMAARGRLGGAPRHKDPQARVRAGQRGGATTKARYGAAYFSRIARLRRGATERLPATRFDLGAARRARGLSRAQAAALAGVHPSTVKVWEGGAAATSKPQAFARLAAALGLAPALATGEGSVSRPS